MCYADDAVLIADLEEHLQRLHHKFVITGTKLNMIVSYTRQFNGTFKFDVNWKLEGKLQRGSWSFNIYG